MQVSVQECEKGELGDRAGLALTGRDDASGIPIPGAGVDRNPLSREIAHQTPAGLLQPAPCSTTKFVPAAHDSRNLPQVAEQHRQNGSHQPGIERFLAPGPLAPPLVRQEAIHEVHGGRWGQGPPPDPLHQVK